MAILWNMTDTHLSNLTYGLINDRLTLNSDVTRFNFTKSRNRLDKFCLSISINTSDTNYLTSTHI